MRTIKGVNNCVNELKSASFGRIYMNVKTLKCFAITYPDYNSYIKIESEYIIEVCKYDYRADQLSITFLKEKIVRSLSDSNYSYLLD